MGKIIELQKNRRKNVHPKLEVLDSIDCRVMYDRDKKYFFIEYDRIDKEYKKQILSSSPLYIGSVIETFVKEKFYDNTKEND